ncbi:ABC transporter permease [Ruminococcus flavefaciens]|uniref:ABC transporter permease n=1 Tax=Ruminococcus flavefaciens TaxID=1265 RepID=UPI0026ED4020|nr:ABC transporter permease [Ruminococcus flavefaciens]MDD7515842.1 ABC transporter permease [Ruminococcus flavefaciens]MDY5691923.1 ABC transporter permease [Ruminococcus flavefaciens]
MQVFKTMFKVMRNRLPSALIYIIVFIVISVIVTNASSKDNKFEASRLKISVFDEDDTPESLALTEFLGKSNDIVEIENDKDTIIDSLYYKRIDYALIINKGYAEKLAAGETADLFSSYHLDENFAVVYMGKNLDEYVNSVKAYLTMGMPVNEALESAADSLSQEADVNMLRVDKGGNSHFSVDFSQYFQFMPYIMISVIISIVSLVLITMNKKDIRFRTNCSCIKESKYTAQLFLGSFVFVFVIWLLLIVVGALLNKEMYTGRAWLAVVNSFILAIVIASMAVLVASFEPKDNVLNLITQVLGLGMSFFCGVFIPTEVLSSSVISVSRFMPVYWYVKANSMIADTMPYSFDGVMKCFMIQIGFAAAMIIVTLLVRKVRYSGAAIATTAKKAALN